MRPGTHFTVTGLHGGPQQPSSETGFEKLGMGFWNAHPTLRLASVCVLYFITFNYLIISSFTRKSQLPPNNFQILQLSSSLHISPIACK